MKRFKLKMMAAMLFISWIILFVPCTVSIIASAALGWVSEQIQNWMEKGVQHLKNEATQLKNESK